MENQHDRQSFHYMPCQSRMYTTVSRNTPHSEWTLNILRFGLILDWEPFYFIIVRCFHRIQLIFESVSHRFLTSRSKISDDEWNSLASNAIRELISKWESWSNDVCECELQLKMVLWRLCAARVLREENHTGVVGGISFIKSIAYGIAVELWFHSYAIELCK